jgi:hypothetical protein
MQLGVANPNQQQHIVYQPQPAALLQPVSQHQHIVLPVGPSGIQSGGINYGQLQQQQPNIQLSQQLNGNIIQTVNNSNTSNNGSFNAVAVAEAAELVNSLLVKSEQQQHDQLQQQQTMAVSNLADLTNVPMTVHTNTASSTAPGNHAHQNDQGQQNTNGYNNQQNQNEQNEEEKDNKSKRPCYLKHFFL